MKHGKLLLENFAVYGLITALNKSIPLLMFPVLMHYLTEPSEIGRFDLYNTILQFGSHFALLGLYDAMFREYFEREDILYKHKVTSTAMYIVLLSSFCVMSALFCFGKFFYGLFLKGETDSFLVNGAAIGIFLFACQSILMAPTRMRNQRRIFMISGALQSLFYYVLAITLVIDQWGYRGMIAANLFTTALLLNFFFVLNRKDFHLPLFDRKIARELLKTGIPLLPCFLIYWIFSSFDKIMLANMLDLGQLGIYSVGARIASVSQFIYSAFAGGWQYFAFSTMKEEDQVGMTSNIFECLGIVVFTVFLCIVPFDGVIFQMLFTGEYTKGEEVFPYLFLSPLLLMLFQIAGNQLLVVKKAYLSTVCLAVGALGNIGFNYYLINLYGIRGCAAATLLGYLLSLVAVLILTSHMGLLRLSKRFLCVSICMLVLITCLFFDKITGDYSLLFFLVFLFLFYRHEMRSLQLKLLGIFK